MNDKFKLLKTLLKVSISLIGIHFFCKNKVFKGVENGVFHNTDVKKQEK